MKLIRLTLLPKSDLKDEIIECSRNHNANGFVLGIVGDLSTVAFQCPNRDEITFLEGPLEIITVNGTVSPDNVHLHISVSDNECKLWGGHLEIGSKILKGAEILIGLPAKQEIINKIESPINKANTYRIEIAVLPNCPWSARIIRILRSNKISYKLINIKNDIEFDQIRIKSKSNTFPQIFIDGEYIGGYDEFFNRFSKGSFK